MDEANDKHCRPTSLRRESVISREPEQAEVRAQGAEQNFEIEEQSRVNETRGKRFNTRRRLDGRLSMNYVILIATDSGAVALLQAERLQYIILLYRHDCCSQ